MNSDISLNLFHFCDIKTKVNLSLTHKPNYDLFLSSLKLRLLDDFRKFLNHVSLDISKPLRKRFLLFWNDSTLNEKCDFWNFWHDKKSYQITCFGKMDLLISVMHYFDPKFSLPFLKNKKRFSQNCQILRNFKNNLLKISQRELRVYIDCDIDSSNHRMRKIISFLKPQEFKLRCDKIEKVFNQISSKRYAALWVAPYQIISVIYHLLCGRSIQIESSAKYALFWYSVYPPRVNSSIDTVAPFLMLGSDQAILERLSLHSDTLKDLDKKRDDYVDGPHQLPPMWAATTMDAFYFYLNKNQTEHFSTFIEKYNLCFVEYLLTFILISNNVVDFQTILYFCQRFASSESEKMKLRIY
jgi:hypothetical protein